MHITQAWLKEKKYWIIFVSLSLITLSIAFAYVDWSAFATDPALALGLLVTTLLAIALPLQIPTSLALFALSLLYLVLGVVSQSAYLEVLGDKSLFGIAALFIVSSAVAEVQLVDKVLSLVLRWPRRLLLSQALYLPFVASVSAFINNTPLVALLIPTLERWSIRRSANLSFYLFPISFTAMLGGMCTLVGTSINLVVQGLAEKEWPDEEFGFWGISPIGVPVAIVGLLYMIAVSKWLFPKSTEYRRYIPRNTTIYSVAEGSRFIGQTLEESGLRQLRGVIIWRIETATAEDSSSDYSVLPGAVAELAVQSSEPLELDVSQSEPLMSSEEEELTGKQLNCELVDLSNAESPPSMASAEYPLKEGDRLFFVGVPEAILQLNSIQGLVNERPSTASSYISNFDNILFEVSLAPHCAFVGRQAELLESEFALRIIAINRNGKTLHAEEEADRLLQAEDVLLVETTAVSAILFNSDQYPHCEHIKHAQFTYLPWWKRIVTLLATIAMIIVSALQIVPIFVSASSVTIICLLIGVLDWSRALAAVDGSVMLTVFASLVVSKALEDSGAAVLISNALIYLLAGHGTWPALLVIFLCGILLSAMISNVSVVSVLFPIFAATTDSLGLSPKAVTWTLAVAASCSFILPVGYQCNLMVQQAGHYSTWQFARVGLGLSLLVTLTGVTAAWLVYV